LAETLQIGIRVAYLDRSDVGNGEVINWVEFGPGTKEEDRPLTLLYRSVSGSLIKIRLELGKC
jgi:ubiquitin thioesterase protein OTUB1